jgi:murein DD-endopeptidase MepM/ murein hydrolase activator NlpD
MYEFLYSGNNDTNGGGQMKNKLILFFKQNGFLLFLFICVCVVAIGTIYIATEDLRTVEKHKEDLIILDEIKDIEEEIALENIEVSSIEDTIENDNPEEGVVSTEEQEPETAEELPDDEVLETVSEDDIEFVEDYEEEEEDTDFVTDKPVSYILPVEGDIITEFSTDKLVYSKTLDDWRAHTGVDIKASVGTKVKAPLDGTVKEVINDDLWGIIIIIDHGNGLVSKIANLGTTEMVKPGIEVKRGDYISTVGNPAPIEMDMESHIHLEVSNNGKLVDPRSITN